MSNEYHILPDLPVNKEKFYQVFVSPAGDKSSVIESGHIRDISVIASNYGESSERGRCFLRGKSTKKEGNFAGEPRERLRLLRFQTRVYAACPVFLKHTLRVPSFEIYII